MAFLERRSRAFAAAIAVVFAVFGTTHSIAGGTWTSRAAMPESIAGAGTAVLDQTIYLLGGFSSSSTCSAVADVWAYDTASGGWTARAPLPSARFGVATAVLNGKIYAFGGAQACGEDEIADTLVYDPASDRWSALSALPPTSVGSGISGANANVVDGKIYLVGGVSGNPNQVLGQVIAYDPVSDSYSTRSPMPLTRYAWAGGTANGGRIYMMGGDAPATSPLSSPDVQIYDPATDSWTAGASMPEADCCSQGAAIGNRIFVLGGGTRTPTGGDGPQGHSFSYDVLADAWRTEPDMPTPRFNVAVAVVGNVIYTLGGSSYQGIPLATVESFTPTPDAAPNQPPVANAGPDQSVAADATCRADVVLNGSGSFDPDNDPLSYLWTGSFGTATGVSPSVNLGSGSNTIVLQVDDGRGGTASDTTQVTVADATPPKIVATGASPSRIWPPNRRMVDVLVTASATDNCGAAQCRVVSVASNEQISSNDWAITGPLSVQLRAETIRGATRVYTVGLQCTDGAGNITPGSVQVNVAR